MQSKMLNAKLITAVFAGFLFNAGVSSAADVYLQARPFDKTVGSETVPMWGFRWCREDATTCAPLSSMDSPGPQINPYTTNFGTQLNISGLPLTDPGLSISGLATNGTTALPVFRTRQGIGVNNANVGTNQTAVFTFDELSVMQRFSLWSSDGNASSVEVTLDSVSVDVSPIVQGPFESLPTTHEIAGGASGRWFTYQITGNPPGQELAIKNTGVAFRVKDLTAVPVSPASGPSLTIHVRNTLRTPTSIVIPGQLEDGAGNPQTATDLQSRARVRSLTQETAGGGGDESYTWSNLRPGTYLYQSGTQPSIQVPMGLFGALVVPGAAGTAYDTGITPDADAVLLFSEIDPLQNQRAAAAEIGTSIQAHGNACVPLADYVAPAQNEYPCTIDYNPAYILINGELSASLPAGDPADTVLLRMLNAGLNTHTPSIVGRETSLVAEDGYPYPGKARQQSHASLPAGKTLDALIDMPAITTENDGNVTFALFDRGPSFTSELSDDSFADGDDALGSLKVGTGSPPQAPQAPGSILDDVYDVAEDTAFSDNVLTNDGGLTDAMLVSTAARGTLTLNPDGSFTYTPNLDFSGVDSFTYSASDGTDSFGAQVTLNVSFDNDAPVGEPDAYVNSTGSDITVAAPGVLANDADPDGDALTAVIDGTAPAGLNCVAPGVPVGPGICADGSFTYAGNTTSFSYSVSDGLVTSTAHVDLTVNTASGIALNVWEAVPVGEIPTVAVTDYRWLVQEDATFNPDPNNPPLSPPLSDEDRIDATQSLNFHQSYMPIVATGCLGCVEPQIVEGDPLVPVPDVPFNMAALDPTKHYYVSVLPNDAGTGEGHTIGGAQIPPGATAVDVFVNSQEIPTAQISVLVFDDIMPTNGFPDGAEAGIGGFQITLEDAGGRYGASGGTMLQDAYALPLRNSLFDDPATCPSTGDPIEGIILTCPDGRALIKDLPPGKYGVIATAPAGDEGNWTQTATIEGSKVVDAWVEAGNSPLLVEFGVSTPHAFIGFVNPSGLVNPSPGSNSVTGRVTLLHDPRPPSIIGTVDSDSYAALSHTRAWVGVNSGAGGGPNIASVHADGDGNFTLDGLPDGTHQLVIWDDYLNQIIAYRTVILPAENGTLADNIAINAWFNRFENNVFLDDGCDAEDPDSPGSQDGIRQDCEAPLAEQAVNLRWRDGTVFQSFPTDLDGFVPFDSVFPFFSWHVVEVDYTRFKATGLTVTVDAGGNDPDGDGIDDFIIPEYDGLLNPQIQTENCTTDDCYSRTDTGPVLTQAYQGFAGQTSIFDWGKAPYEDGENGGISGIVFYGSTRGENDPRITAGDPWEPGIPSAKVRLYREVASLGSHVGVTNAGFENPALGNLGTSATVPDWTKVGAGIIVNPSNNANVDEGSNAYRFNGEGSLTQTLGDVLTEGTYTLRVAVGDQGSLSIFIADYQVQLGVDNGGFVLLAEDNDSQNPNQGFLTSTVTYTAAAGDPNLGLPLMIRLVATNTSSTAWVLFDDVRLAFAADGVMTALALVEETTTDSWDASEPTGCRGEDPDSDFAKDVLDGQVERCFDGMRNWNQARPGVFDGGYAFGAEDHLTPGTYVVEVEVPPGYELYKEEDVNVGFGDTFGGPVSTGFAAVSVTLPNGMLVLSIPDQASIEAAMGFQVGIAQPPCVGAYHTVPTELSLFPGQAAPFAGAERPLCDRKQVILSDKGQAAADFHLFTSTPVAAQFSGLTLDDLTNESDTSSPNFGEKWGAGNMPIAIRDFKGRQVYRGYTDAYGRFSGLMPSTFTANAPIPSGYSPAMYLTCMNDAGDGDIPDSRRLTRYGAACYTLQYMPGTTTYVDTPIIPTAAFAGGYNPADCAANEGTPVITSVGNDTADTFGPLVAPEDTIIILSAGDAVVVPNPAYDGPLGTEPPTIMRDFSFGSGGGPNRGTVELVESDGTRHTLVTLNGGNGWNPNRIRAVAPATPMVGQLVVTRGDGVNSGNATVNAVTVTVGTETPTRVLPGTGTPIQDAIDAANPGDLILVAPGAYKEQVVMWKPVRLQGSGSETLINAIKLPKNVSEWTNKVTGLVDDGLVDLLPGQDPTFANEVGTGIIVLAKRFGPNRFAINASRIDGFSIINANIGGGMVVNGWAHGLEVSNNTITGNSGSLHGGIRVGHAFLPGLVPNANGVVPAFNNNVNIHHNAITLNGGVGFQGNGGGLSLATGSNNYKVTNNLICGNLTLGDGAGIGHLGQSNNGRIESNQILFNQSFNPDRNPSGGGILIAGEPATGGALTLGAGNVIVDANLIQGNEAGSGHGAGIRTQFVNGAEIAVREALATPLKPWRVRMTNNMIVNNVAGYSGAGISLQDSINAQIINNTIANNDSTATVGPLIGAGDSDPQPAGISSGAHSLALGVAIGDPNGFSDPAPGSFINNIVWHNRAFYWDGEKLKPELKLTNTGDCPIPDNIDTYWDLGVLGQPQASPAVQLDPRRSILSTLGIYAGGNNTAGDPNFLDDYCNGSRSLTVPGPMGSIAAFGEGGNFLNVRWGPLTRAWPAGSTPWDYHVGAGIAVDTTWGGPATDFDNQARPAGSNSGNRIRDRGADELLP